jgi:hypothetical protein
MLVIKLLVFLAGFFRPRITNVKTAPPNPANMEQAGALVPNAAVVSAVAALSANAAPAFGNWSQTLVPANLTAATYLAGQLVGGIIRRFSPGAAFTDCTDTATNIVAAIPGAVPLQTFPVIIANLGSGAQTLAGGTGVTIAGTAAIASATARLFLGQVTGSGAVTLTNCFGWNLGTGGTLVAGL